MGTPVQTRYAQQQENTDLNDKLVFDPKTNRFYEGNIGGNAEDEEFCLKDASTGQVILLTKVLSFNHLLCP